MSRRYCPNFRNNVLIKIIPLLYLAFFCNIKIAKSFSFDSLKISMNQTKSFRQNMDSVYYDINKSYMQTNYFYNLSPAYNNLPLSFNNLFNNQSTNDTFEYLHFLGTLYDLQMSAMHSDKRLNYICQILSGTGKENDLPIGFIHKKIDYLDTGGIRLHLYSIKSSLFSDSLPRIKHPFDTADIVDIGVVE